MAWTGSIGGMAGFGYLAFKSTIAASFITVGALKTTAAVGAAVAVAGVSAVSGPFILAGAITASCFLIGATFGVAGGVIGGIAKAWRHHKNPSLPIRGYTAPLFVPPPAPAQPSYNYWSSRKPVVDQLKDMSAEEREKTLRELKETCRADFDAIAKKDQEEERKKQPPVLAVEISPEAQKPRIKLKK